ncbi:MAG: CDP-alcohol phosphatidyltransferase family protein [Alphaproteobacteria bacterium]
MKPPPYDRRIARVLIRPLACTPVTPNHVTTLTLLLALAASALFARGDAMAANWGAGLFALSRFLDHFDGELARQNGCASRFGYYFDYIVGATSYAAMFLGIGVGLASGPLDGWALALGVTGSCAAFVTLLLNLAIDRRKGFDDGETVGYPRYGGFELEDGVYLIAPIVWLGWLAPFLVLAAACSVAYCLWTARVLAKTPASRCGASTASRRSAGDAGGSRT